MLVITNEEPLRIFESKVIKPVLPVAWTVLPNGTRVFHFDHDSTSTGFIIVLVLDS